MSAMSSPEIAISLCTTCFHRLHQLRQTFVANVRTVIENSDAEWVIFNYGGIDDLHQFMMDKLVELPSRIIYVRDNNRRPWHASVAKNMVHRLGSGRMLMNIDCDNYIGDAITVIKSQPAKNCKLLQLWSGKLFDGTFGRIAVERELFYFLGGYDESFYPMGYQDGDFLRRAAASGVRARLFPCTGSMAVKNTKEESIRYCSMNGLTWNDYNRMNQAKSVANITARKFTANVDIPWAEMNVTTYLGLAQ
jgi:hypothetical protein